MPFGSKRNSDIPQKNMENKCRALKQTQEDGDESLRLEAGRDLVVSVFASGTAVTF